MKLKVDPSIMLRAFGPDGDEHQAFLGRLLLDNDPVDPVLRLCVDWDGRDLRRGTLYKEYLSSLKRVRGGRKKFDTWWQKLKNKRAIDPSPAPPGLPVVRTDYPGWREHEYMLIGLALADRGRERAVVAEFVPGYGPAYFQRETLQRLENENPPVNVLDIMAANKLIQLALVGGSEVNVPVERGEAGNTALDQATRMSLYGRIAEYFSIDELKDELCFPLDIEPEWVWAPADKLQAAVRKLVTYCERRPPAVRLLVAQCNLKRPGVRWPQLPS